MKAKRNSIFRVAAVAMLCSASSLITSCNSDTHSDNADTTLTDTMNTMNVDSVMADTVNAAGLNPASKPAKKGVAMVSEPIPEETGEIKLDKDKVYNYAEVPPVFPGGQSALDDYIKDNIKYPSSAMESGIEGKVSVQFIVDENGHVYGTKVLSKPLGYGIEEEAMKVVNNMPQWTPGKVKGKSVKTYRVLPISFTLQ
ncbi:MAG: energy transducer TonB [Chitinophagales bacterium]|nr:energy transducer TonB [Chitinophagaceae bacterium]MBP9881903.1 energy transducer TonB [Chitinophagales bacterium]